MISFENKRFMAGGLTGADLNPNASLPTPNRMDQTSMELSEDSGRAVASLPSG